MLGQTDRRLVRRSFSQGGNHAELVITLPEHKVEYLENISEYIAETIAGIIEELVYNHFIQNFEIIDSESFDIGTP